MEKIPNPIEDLIEMHEKVVCLEERCTEMDQLLNCLIKEKQAAQNQLMTKKPTSTEILDVKNNLIKQLRDDIGWFIKLKSELSGFNKAKAFAYDLHKMDKKLALKNDPYQFAITQFADLDGTFMALGNLISIQSNVLKHHEEIVRVDCLPMALIEEIIKTME